LIAGFEKGADRNGSQHVITVAIRPGTIPEGNLRNLSGHTQANRPPSEPVQILHRF
jgi:hypothetical protein